MAVLVGLLYLRCRTNKQTQTDRQTDTRQTRQWSCVAVAGFMRLQPVPRHPS